MQDLNAFLSLVAVSKQDNLVDQESPEYFQGFEEDETPEEVHPPVVEKPVVEALPVTTEEVVPIGILATVLGQQLREKAIIASPAPTGESKETPVLSDLAALLFPLRVESDFYKSNPEKLVVVIEAANKKAEKVVDLIGDPFADLFTIYVNSGAAGKGTGEYRTLWVALAKLGKLEGVYLNNKGIWEPKEVKICGITVNQANLELPAEDFKGEGVNQAFDDSQIASIWGHHLFSKLATLPTQGLLDFVMALTSNTKLNKEGNLVIQWMGDQSQHVINFQDLTWENGRKERKANTNVKVGKFCYSTEVALAILAIKAARCGSSKETNAMLVETPNLWERDETYGDTFNEKDLNKVILDNLSLPAKFAPVTKGFPFIALGNTSIGANDLSELLETGVLAAPDKYNKQWLTTGIGAEAMLIGQNVDGDIISIHDMSKVGKVYNRPPQATKYLRAILPNRKLSGLGVQLSNGKVVYGGGQYLKTALTNSRFGHGSGVAMTNPSLEFDYAVDKTVRQTIHALRIPAATRVSLSKLAAKQGISFASALIMKLESKVAELIGKTFAPGEEMFSLCDGKYVVVKNNTKAEWWTVMSYRFLETNSNEENADCFELVLGVRMSAKDKCVKLRGLGKKLTTLPYKTFGLSQQADIILNNETLKGFVAHIEAFVIAVGGGIYHPSSAEIQLNNGSVVDLKEPENDFTRWLQSSVKVEVMSFNMAKSEFDALYSIKPELFDSEDVEWSIINETTVCIKETLEVVYCELPYDVEVSTPRESISESKMTLEQLTALRIQDTLVADAIGGELQNRSQKVKALINQFKLPGKDVPTVEVDTLSGRKQIRSIIGDLKKQYSDDTAVLKKLEVVYPKGVILQVTLQGRKEQLYVVPSAVLAFGGLIGGTASGWVLQVFTLLAEITDEVGDTKEGRDTKVRSWLSKVSARLQGWVKTMCRSESILKSITRAGKVVNGKVKTSYHPALHSADGVPVVILHPNCPIVSMLGVENGDLVGLQRTPMPFNTACRVKLHWHGQIGHIMVSPFIWGASNEGDGDGDGAGLLNLTKYGVNTARALTMNNSLMGIQGYFYAYGKDLPILDFMSLKDKIGKKSLSSWPKKDKAGEPQAIAVVIPRAEYGRGASLVHSHYSYNVGVAYGMCSALTFVTANYLAKPNHEKHVVETLLQACAIVWRKVYEGQGLSGYSPESCELFQSLVIAAGTKASESEKKVALANVASILNVEEAVAKWLVHSRRLCMSYNAKERWGAKKVAQAEQSYLVGALRRIGQGRTSGYDLDTYNPSIDEFDGEGGSHSKSLFEAVEDFGLLTRLEIGFVKAALADGISIHKELVTEFGSVNAELEMGF